MSKRLQLQFDANQEYQLDAVAAVVGLFDGLPRAETGQVLAGQEDVVANLPPDEELSYTQLKRNLGRVQEQAGIPIGMTGPSLQAEVGIELAGVSEGSHESYHFTVEMETGTGKTYVYLRAMYELYARFGFRKFVVVVPSTAIYEGVLKNIAVTAAHFRSLYDGTHIAAIGYDGAQLSRLRDFATSTLPVCLVMTLAAFNKKTNNFYKASEKLPGERRPYQYVQETRPIVILDEPQNMESDISQQAIRTLHPLFALRFSATHRTSPNPIYRLTPFEAFELGLVKRVQVDAVTEEENFNRLALALRHISGPPSIRATVRTLVLDRGVTTDRDVELAHGDDLGKKTQRDEYRDRGYVVSEINAARDYVLFENGMRLSLGEESDGRAHVFRHQIRATIEAHIARQAALEPLGIKVLSLFFIDRVANYTAADGVIRRLFDEEFNRLKARSGLFAAFSPEDVRRAYFAVKREKDGSETALDTEGRNEAERTLEKAAYELIMRGKEQLLSLDEPVGFIFAHSALKEGWDNPNVFQICTLNQTQSETKKRQEIGRGMRLCVNQDGERVRDEAVNVLTVVANERYRDFVRGLQQEYVDDNAAERPPDPTPVRRTTATRRDEHFQSEDFQAFWKKLARHANYRLRIEPQLLIESCVERLNNAAFEAPRVVVERGQFTMEQVTLVLVEAKADRAHLEVRQRSSSGQHSAHDVWLGLNESLGRKVGIEALLDYGLMEVSDAGSLLESVVFTNNIELRRSEPYEVTLAPQPEGHIVRQAVAPNARYPIFDLMGRAARETGLTRATLTSIYAGLAGGVKEHLLANPEGFASAFISHIRDELANHVADFLEFDLSAGETEIDLEELFPPSREHPQRELIEAGERGLYDRAQKDSDVEERFVNLRLKDDPSVVFFFKFPPKFKVDFPRLIGDYNPDWGIVRLDEAGQYKLQLVRETKGAADKRRLQYGHERRKIDCAIKYFEAVEIDYRHITPDMLDWYQPAPELSPKLSGLD